MVTVVDYAIRQRKDGSEFFVLILQGGLSLVQSRNTGNYYATVKRCSIPSTFDEETAKAMVGKQVPGSIQRQSCEEYEFVAQNTGEVVTLDYRWAYVPEGETVENGIFEGAPEVVQVEKKKSFALQV